MINKRVHFKNIKANKQVVLNQADQLVALTYNAYQLPVEDHLLKSARESLSQLEDLIGQVDIISKEVFSVLSK